MCWVKPQTNYLNPKDEQAASLGEGTEVKQVSQTALLRPKSDSPRPRIA